MPCVFCKIINKEIPADIVFENKNIVVFKNVEPEAPVHLLIVPKRHIEWKDDFQKEELLLLSEIINTAKKIARERGVDRACKFIFNVGKASHITHIHLHLLGGWEDTKIPMHNI